MNFPDVVFFVAFFFCCVVRRTGKKYIRVEVVLGISRKNKDILNLLH